MAAKHSTFKTSNDETLTLLLRDVHKSNHNRIVWIKPDGTEEDKAHYDYIEKINRFLRYIYILKVDFFKDNKNPPFRS